MLNRLRNWAQKLRPSKTTVEHGHVFALYRGEVLWGRIVLLAPPSWEQLEVTDAWQSF